jgi:hypothetical protein
MFRDGVGKIRDVIESFEPQAMDLAASVGWAPTHLIGAHPDAGG